MTKQENSVNSAMADKDFGLSERKLHEAAIMEAGYVVVAAIHEQLALNVQIVPDFSDPKDCPKWRGRTWGFPEGVRMPEVAVAGLVAWGLSKEPESKEPECKEPEFDGPDATLQRIVEYASLLDLGKNWEVRTMLLPWELTLLGSFDNFDEIIHKSCKKSLSILRKHPEFFDWVVEKLRDKFTITPEEVIRYLRDRLVANRKDFKEWDDLAQCWRYIRLDDGDEDAVEIPQ